MSCSSLSAVLECRWIHAHSCGGNKDSSDHAAVFHSLVWTEAWVWCCQQTGAWACGVLLLRPICFKVHLHTWVVTSGCLTYCCFHFCHQQAFKSFVWFKAPCGVVYRHKTTTKKVINYIKSCLLFMQRAVAHLDTEDTKVQQQRRGHRGILTTDLESAMEALTSHNAAYVAPKSPGVRLRGMCKRFNVIIQTKEAFMKSWKSLFWWRCLIEQITVFTPTPAVTSLYFYSEIVFFVWFCSVHPLFHICAVQAPEASCWRNTLPGW